MVQHPHESVVLISLEVSCRPGIKGNFHYLIEKFVTHFIAKALTPKYKTRIRGLALVILLRCLYGLSVQKTLFALPYNCLEDCIDRLKAERIS